MTDATYRLHLDAKAAFDAYVFAPGSEKKASADAWIEADRAYRAALHAEVIAEDEGRSAS